MTRCFLIWWVWLKWAATGDAADGGSAQEVPYFVEIADSAGVAVEHRARSFENPYAHITEGYTALGASASGRLVLSLPASEDRRKRA